MKKVMSLLLVAVMVIAMATTAFAANDTVTFTFKSSNNPGFGSYNAQISYDSAALELVSIDEGKLTAGKGNFASNLSNGKVGYMGSVEVTGDGVLFTATFKVKDGAAADEYKISAAIIPGSASSTTGAAADFSITGGGTVEVECDHAWGEWTETKAPTCTEKGEKTRTCSKCGETQTEAVDALGHTWSDWEVTKKATCKAKGEKTRTCSVCGEVETKTIKKADHKYKDGKCIWCGKVKAGYDNVPSTGDITPVVTMGVVAMISVVAAAAYVTKRRITK